MDMNEYFKSIVEQDNEQIVICNTNHEIIYMNKAAAAAFDDDGGYSLIGKSLLDCHTADSCERIKMVVEWFLQSKNNNRVFTFHNVKHNRDIYMIALRNKDGDLIGYYEKHESRNPEKVKRYEME